FARGERRLVDLGRLVLEHLPPPLGLAPILAQRFEPRLDLAQVLERLTYGRAERHEAGVGVQKIEVDLRIEQALRLLLSADCDEPRRQLAEDRDGNERSVDGRLALASG